MGWILSVLFQQNVDKFTLMSSAHAFFNRNDRAENFSCFDGPRPFSILLIQTMQFLPVRAVGYHEPDDSSKPVDQSERSVECLKI